MNFRQKVLNVVSQIPPGEVLNYKEVAKRAGSLRAFRAVGNILTNNDLINHLISTGVLQTPELIAAFHEIKRADFVRPFDLEFAYEDYPLPIGFGQTISQPTTVIFMLELLSLETGEKVLDIGSGSGWTTALIASMDGPAGRVYGLEIIPELVEFGRKNLKKYDLPNAQILQAPNRVSGSGQATEKVGYKDFAPYDKILVSAAARHLPNELVNNLKPGGRLVLPIGTSIWQVDKLPDGRIEREEFSGFSFVPLIQ